MGIERSAMSAQFTSAKL